MIKRIHVNKQKIAQNRKNGTNMPVITCKTYKQNEYGNEVIFFEEGRVVYRPHKPLSCGARLWIETNGPVMVFDADGKETAYIA